MEMFKQNINETNDTKKNFIFKSNIKLKNISFLIINLKMKCQIKYLIILVLKFKRG